MLRLCIFMFSVLLNQFLSSKKMVYGCQCMFLLYSITFKCFNWDGCLSILDEQQLAASKLIGILLKDWSDLKCLFTYFHHWSNRFSAADTILSEFIGLPWWIFHLGRACRTYMSVVSLHFSSQLFQLHRNVLWMQERGCQRRSAKWLLIKQFNPINLRAKPRTLSHIFLINQPPTADRPI